jgi:hypothetical protein
LFQEFFELRVKRDEGSDRFPDRSLACIDWSPRHAENIVPHLVRGSMPPAPADARGPIASLHADHEVGPRCAPLMKSGLGYLDMTRRNRFRRATFGYWFEVMKPPVGYGRVTGST